jgi:hypothetical protein
MLVSCDIIRRQNSGAGAAVALKLKPSSAIACFAISTLVTVSCPKQIEGPLVISPCVNAG